MSKISGLKCLLFLIITLIWLVPSTQAQKRQADTTVLVVGSSTIKGDNMNAGREDAIDSGLVAAVSRVLIDVLPPETLSGSFQVLNDTIISRPDQFVQDYKVVTESRVGATYRLLVQATVSIKRLEVTLKAAGIRLDQVPYPRVLFCVAEKRTADQAFQYWWSGQPALTENIAAATLEESLANTGFVVIRPPKKINIADPSPDLSPEQAIAFGKQLNAEVVVVGTAYAEEAANTMGGTVRSYRGYLRATAYRVTDGAQLSQVQQSALTAGQDALTGGNEALRNTAQLAAQDLTVQIGRAWFKQASGSTQVEIVVLGIGGNIANFVKFRGALGDTSGVDSIQLKEMMPNEAVLSVEYQGKAQALADALLLLGFDTFGINIESVEINTIRMQLVPR